MAMRITSLEGSPAHAAYPLWGPWTPDGGPGV